MNESGSESLSDKGENKSDSGGSSGTGSGSERYLLRGPINFTLLTPCYFSVIISLSHITTCACVSGDCCPQKVFQAFRGLDPQVDTYN